MIGATLYLVGKEVPTGEYVKDAIVLLHVQAPGASTRGIEKVIVRDDQERYRVIEVAQWIADDESLKGVLGY